MEAREYTYEDIRIMMTNVAGALVLMKRPEEANALGVLCHVMGYRTEGPASYLEIDEALDDYNDDIQILRNYLDHGKARLSMAPSPTDSAAK